MSDFVVVDDVMEEILKDLRAPAQRALEEMVVAPYMRLKIKLSPETRARYEALRAQVAAQPEPVDEEPVHAALNPKTLRWADLPEVLTRKNEGNRLKVWDAITYAEIPNVCAACPGEGWIEVTEFRGADYSKVRRRRYVSFYFVDCVTGEEVRPPE